MKILMVNRFHYIKGGSERYYFNLSDLLKKNGHEIIFFSMKDKKNTKTKWNKYFINFVLTEKIKYNLQGFKSALNIIWSFEARNKIKKILKDEKPDIVHLHNFSHQISPSILSIIKKSGTPVVMTVHDYKILCPNARMFTKNKICEKCKTKKYYQCLKNKCIKNSKIASFVIMIEMYLHRSVLKNYQKNISLYITPSKFLQKKMIEWGINKNKIIHLPYFVKKSNHTSSQINSDNNILFFGRLSHEKGILTLIKSTQNTNNINLQIVGTGPQEEEIKNFIHKSNFKNVKLLGYKSTEKLKKYILNALFTVTPSEWYENYPLSVLESHALKKPSVVSDLGGLPEMIPNQNQNFIFKAGDFEDLNKKISNLINNKKIIHNYIKNIEKKIYTDNSPDDHYKKIINIYTSLIKKYASNQ